MSKIGVGVGDDFPVDDGAPRNTGEGPRSPGETPRDDRAEFEDWKRRRDAHRAQRDEWHRRKAEWKAQWRQQRHAWRDEMHARYSEGIYSGPNGDFAYPMGGRRHYGRGRFPAFFGGHGLIRIVGLFLVVALLIFAVTHIGYILAGLVAVAILFAAWHHYGHDPFDLGPYDRRARNDYARPVTTPPPAPTPSVEKPNDPAQ